MNIFKTKKTKLRAKRVFLKKGTCSNTFFYILNREFGHPKEMEERALDPLAGGIVQQGYQCGMLWGASMAVGAESYRRHKDQGIAIAVAIRATQNIMNSFENRTKCIDCEDFTKTDFKNKKSFAKYMLTGKFWSCYKLAEQWAPEAIKAAYEGLAIEQFETDQKAISCASEVLKKMGGSEEEIIMVAGFAGGLGLGGSGCGALGATIWKTILKLIRKGEWKTTMSDPDSEKIINRFYEVTDYKMECHEICGKSFNSINEHTEFIKNGGCDKLINVLANN
ncbi:C-GCAxxG-C-C family (seleno)protein [Bacteroidota bacterium]